MGNYNFDGHRIQYEVNSKERHSVLGGIVRVKVRFGDGER